MRRDKERWLGYDIKWFRTGDIVARIEKQIAELETEIADRGTGAKEKDGA